MPLSAPTPTRPGGVVERLVERISCCSTAQSDPPDQCSCFQIGTDSLQRVDRELGGRERVAAMRRRDHDDDRHLGEPKVADAMQERDALRRRASDARISAAIAVQRPNCGTLVGLVGHADDSRTTLGVIAHDTGERDDRAGRRHGRPLRRGRGRQGLVGERDPVAARRVWAGARRPVYGTTLVARLPAVAPGECVSTLARRWGQATATTTSPSTSTTRDQPRDQTRNSARNPTTSAPARESPARPARPGVAPPDGALRARRRASLDLRRPAPVAGPCPGSRRCSPARPAPCSPSPSSPSRVRSIERRRRRTRPPTDGDATTTRTPTAIEALTRLSPSVVAVLAARRPGHAPRLRRLRAPRSPAAHQHARRRYREHRAGRHGRPAPTHGPGRRA